MLEQVTHEIGTPALELRLRFPAIDEKLVAAGIDTSERQHIENLVQQIISPIDVYLGSSASLYDSTATVCNMNSVCDEAIMHFKTLYPNGFKVTKTYASGPLVYARRSDLFQVIRNLIKNAIEAVPSDDKAEIEVVTSIRSKSTNDDRIVSVVIRDKGTGIDESIRDEVFKDGFSTKKPSRGRGHGLYIVKNIISDLSGDVQIRANPSGDKKGIEIEVTLPFKSAKQ
jgi:signal transduction histidine kinase